ncbi:MAG: tRNA pseudouridine(38-40) synthase TruA [Methanobacteriota archaeon]|nr:MAG: tRNA pseudouridine(38-40) synthase TruA [Euryarchaeota archaeon]
MRVALKFWYDGSVFWGYQRQLNVRTVEGDIIKALRKTKMIRDVKKNKFQSSSRTDRGASAVGNVLAFDTDFSKGQIPKALNSKVYDIYFWGIAQVEDDFNPRYAKQRWYRYHLNRELDFDKLKSASSLFLGEHDFKNFCRKSERSSMRRIDSINVIRKRDFIYLDVKGESFLWNMIRRMVSALVKNAKGELPKKAIANALAGKRSDMGMAPAHPLILMDVSYGFPFETKRSAIPPSFAKNYEEALIKGELFSAIQKKMCWRTTARRKPYIKVINATLDARGHDRHARNREDCYL